MLKPSYSELMQILNNNPDLDSKITSRYAVVIAASKRARQLIDGAEPQAKAETNKAVSVAVMEMRDGLINIFPEADAETAESDSPSMDYPDMENGSEHIENVAAYAAYDELTEVEQFQKEAFAMDDDDFGDEDFGDDAFEEELFEDEPFEEE
jgi:DNA-directed RNA polymerase subunit omega